VPAVEFGPTGSGHHGPEEWVSISSLVRYRQALTDFVLQLPKRLDAFTGADGAATPLRAVEGGLA
jgi:succinyl-diaminopimelate desuccinylase